VGSEGEGQGRGQRKGKEKGRGWEEAREMGEGEEKKGGEGRKGKGQRRRETLHPLLKTKVGAYDPVIGKTRQLVRNMIIAMVVGLVSYSLIAIHAVLSAYGVIQDKKLHITFDPIMSEKKLVL
jgi:hypothetical protein